MRNTRMGTPAARVAALITAGALAAGVGAASASAGASPHARAATEVRAFAASALTSSTLDLTTNTWYTCVGPCATATYFTDYGVARSGLTVFGFSGTGTEVSFLKDGCSISSDHFALTEQAGAHKGDTIWFSTTSDKYCPTKNPNLSNETESITIAGGTGAFKSATGTGSITLTVLGQPQIGFGTIAASITY